MKKKLLILFVLFGLRGTFGMAYDFQNGLYYNIISESEKTVSVGYNDEKDYFVGYGNINIPETVINNGKKYTVVRVGNLGGFELYDTPSMTTAIIPKTVVSISAYAFYNYNKLKDVTILGNNLSTIGTHAFQSCNLSSINLPSSVTSIGDYAFSDCKNLRSFIIKSTIAPSLDGNNVFRNIPDDCILYYPAGSDYSVWKKYFNKAIAVHSGTCGDNLTWMYNPENHKLFIDGIGAMTDYTDRNSCPWFQYIKNPASDFPKYYAVEVEIDEGVTHIGSNAFVSNAVCYAHIPNSVTSIGAYAFSSSHDLTIYSKAEKSPSLGESAFTNYSSDTHSLIYPVGADYSTWSEYFQTSDEYQDEISGEFVGPYSHVFNWHLNTVTGLLSITGGGEMPDWNFTTFAPWFRFRKFISSVKISNNIQSIGANAFRYSKWIETIEMSDRLYKIGENAFSYCYKLENVKLPKNLTVINSSTFDNCITLSKVILPEGVKVIESYAFNGCNELEYIEFPTTLTTIEKGAFTYVYKLDTIISHSRNIELSNYYTYFSNLPSNAILYYPTGSDYSTWKKYFSTMIPITEDIDINIPTNNKWSTCALAFDAELPANVQAYTCNGINDEFLLLEKAESLKAYTPYILYAENGYKGTLTGTVDVSNYQETVTDGLLNGAITEQQTSAGYVLQNQGHGSMFHRISNGKTFTIPAGKCWLSTVVPDVATVRMSFDGTTGVEELKTDKGQIQKGTIYDLNGRPVKNPKKGQIYIINGKKALKL